MVYRYLAIRVTLAVALSVIAGCTSSAIQEGPVAKSIAAYQACIMEAVVDGLEKVQTSAVSSTACVNKLTEVRKSLQAQGVRLPDLEVIVKHIADRTLELSHAILLSAMLEARNRT